jgi:hypothetical protein
MEQPMLQMKERLLASQERMEAKPVANLETRQVEAALEQLQRSAVVGIGVEFTVSQELLWLWHDSSGTQERKRPPLEAGIRRLVKRQQTGETKDLL